MIESGSIIYAGSSSTLPERDFVIYAGLSILENRDYIILFDLKATHSVSLVQILAFPIVALELNAYTHQSALLYVAASAGELTKFVAYSFSADTHTISISSNITFLGRYKLHLVSRLTLSASPISFTYNRIWSFFSSRIDLSDSLTYLDPFEAIVLSPQVCIIGIQSYTLTFVKSTLLATAYISVLAGLLRTEYYRVFEVITSNINVNGNTAGLSTFFPIIFNHTVHLVSVLAVVISIRNLRFISHSTHTIRISASLLTTKYNRIWNITCITISIPAKEAQFYFNSLACANIQLSGINAVLAANLVLGLAVSKLSLSSSDLIIKNPYLVGLNSTLLVVSPFSNLYFLPTGYVPDISPTTRSFEPPFYSTKQTSVMSGRINRNMLCSKSSNARLTLEYNNINDLFVKDVLSSYDDSLGTRYGFFLPAAVLRGAGSDLAAYIQSSNNRIKWYYESRPKVLATSKGVSNLTISLKTRIDIY